jgi:hypothetical protein
VTPRKVSRQENRIRATLQPGGTSGPPLLRLRSQLQTTLAASLLGVFLKLRGTHSVKQVVQVHLLASINPLSCRVDFGVSLDRRNYRAGCHVHLARLLDNAFECRFANRPAAWACLLPGRSTWMQDCAMPQMLFRSPPAAYAGTQCTAAGGARDLRRLASRHPRDCYFSPLALLGEFVNAGI